MIYKKVHFDACIYTCMYLTMQTVDEYFDTVDLGYLDKLPLNLSFYDDVAPVCYDAMWTLALALNNTIEGIQVYWCLYDHDVQFSNRGKMYVYIIVKKYIG